MASRLLIDHVSKTFGRTVVLRDVRLEIAAGEIHGLVGQNGSGKSTVIKVLSGVHPPDPGASVQVDGKALALPLTPREMTANGLSFVHQNLGLDDRATVIENVRIGRYAVGRVSRRIRWNQEADAVAATLARLGAPDLNPYATVGSLDHAGRATVAIARAVQDVEPGAGCIVFDESTQSLPRDVLEDFYAQVRGIAGSGTSVLIVSHRLDEVLALCDRVTVLEDGAVTLAAQSTASLTEAELGRMIMGDAATVMRDAAPDRAPVTTTTPAVLSVTGLAGGAVRDVDLSVREGEIVGLIGNADSGYDVVPYLLGGVIAASGGTMTTGSTSLPAGRLTPAEAARRGVALVPAGRAEQGIAVRMLALDNLVLPRLVAHGRGFVRRHWQLDEFRAAIDRLGLTPPDPYLHAGSLSGGNQQKLLLAKWLLGRPSVLLVHEPVQAVDVGARADILAELQRQAAQGVGVLIVSLETQDLASICDRVLIVRDGMVADEVTGDRLTAHGLLDLVYPEGTEALHDAA